MAATDMACQELVELVTDYLDDALEPEDRLRFQEHLAGCEGCSSYVEQMRTTIEVTGRLDEGSLPPEGMEQLLAAFRDWKRR